MPRLLILCEYPTVLGGERSMLATLPAVAAAGFDVQIAAPPHGALAETIRSAGVRHIAWQTRDDRDQRLPLAALRGDLAGILQQVEPQLIHANSLSTARIAGPVTADAGYRSIGHLRDIAKLSRQVVDDLNRHTRLIAVSQATRSFHTAQGVDGTRCVALHNGVDLDKFQPRAASGYLHDELRLEVGTRLVAIIGQIGLRKGIDVALLAASQLACEFPDVHWVIVGERTSNKAESLEFEQLLHATAASTPLVGRIHFLGSRGDVDQLMNDCILLVHAARQEPLGRVLLEAAASGLPVVATDVGGTREIFRTTEDGALIVPPDDCVALAHSIRALLTDETLRIRIGAATRRRAETAFDIRTAASRLIEQYNQVIC